MGRSASTATMECREPSCYQPSTDVLTSNIDIKC